ncbi:MAG TPA: indole-3-glycerol phosphate synthase TrpC, partial [Microbacteriaceae bacterium]
MAQNPKTDLLRGLYKNSLEQSQKRRQQLSLADLKSLANQQTPTDPRPFFLNDELSVIAEIKRASPSKGDLAEISDPLALAKIYESAGASAISVLTEESGFKGSLYDLEIVSQGVSIPTLRKDFISTEEQILEAKAYGASMVLLIMLGLDDEQYKNLFQFSKEQGLEVLVETHSEQEIERAL